MKFIFYFISTLLYYLNRHKHSKLDNSYIIQFYQYFMHLLAHLRKPSCPCLLILSFSQRIIYQANNIVQALSLAKIKFCFIYFVIVMDKLLFENVKGDFFKEKEYKKIRKEYLWMKNNNFNHLHLQIVLSTKMIVFLLTF